jgi:hypothetical protein
MPIGSFLSHVFRRLIIELVEFFVATQFVPLVALALWEIMAISAFSMLLFSHNELMRFLQVPTWLLSFDGLYQALLFFSVAIYAVARVVRLVNPMKRWWSVRRKAGIILTLITFGYMICFALLFATRPATPIEPWVFICALTVLSAVYGFGVRYAANKVLRRLQRFGIR